MWAVRLITARGIGILFACLVYLKPVAFPRKRMRSPAKIPIVRSIEADTSSLFLENHGDRFCLRCPDSEVHLAVVCHFSTDVQTTSRRPKLGRKDLWKIGVAHGSGRLGWRS